MSASNERVLLILLLLSYLLVGTAFALLTPDWQVPDEPAHVNYLRQLGPHQPCCPVIEAGDWNQDRLWEAISAAFPPGTDLSGIEYEDHQPPLYYQLTSLVYGLSPDPAVALKLARLVSVLFGAGVVYCAYALSKTMLPDRPGVALGAAALVGFLPQHVAMLAGVNNDSLAELLIGLSLLMTARYLLGQVEANQRLAQVLVVAMLATLTILLVAHRIPITVGAVFFALLALAAERYNSDPQGDWPLWGIGLLLGLIFATKTTGYYLGGLIPLLILLHSRTWRERRRRLTLLLIPALILGGMWWLRNLGVYGMPDFLGLRAHDLVVADQPRTAAQIAQLGFGPYLQESLQISFNSFWGQFGWMTLPLQAGFYRIFLIFTLIASGGLVVNALLPQAENEQRRPHARLAWALLWGAVLLTLLAYIYYNSEFLQRQGRYLFPALIPMAIFLAWGLDSWRRVLPRVAALQYMPLLLIGLLAPLDLYLLLRVIRPLLS